MRASSSNGTTPWSWRHPSRYFQRNHRKLLLIDERELFLGRFNIRLENSRRFYGEGRTRDTHVLISGELALHGAALFDQMWQDAEHPYADFATREGTVFDPFLTEQFYRDLTDASEVTPDAWAVRGWAERGLETIGWTARRLL